MTNLQKEKTQQAVVNFCKVKGISKNGLATRLGISSATISNMVNGKWDHIDEKLWRQVSNYVKAEKNRQVYETADFKSVFNLCKKAIEDSLMIGLIGDTGMGKTTALTTFAYRMNVYYYYVDGTVTPKIFLSDLLQEMGVQFEGSLNSMLNRAASELNTQDSPLLILDECAKLSDKMMLLLHSLRDKTNGNCGFVLAGMPAFKNRLIKHVNKGTNGYAEFFRRINIWHQLIGLKSGESIYILETNGITDEQEQRRFKRLNRFGDLMNEINLFKTLNYSNYEVNNA